MVLGAGQGVEYSVRSKIRVCSLTRVTVRLGL